MRVLFVCTGNICRSPFAEHLFRRLLAERGLAGVEVSSAGLFAQDGGRVVEAMARAAAAAGVDLSAHRARPLDHRSLGAGDLVFVMEENQRRQLLSLARIDPRAVRLLGRFAPGGPDEVADPVGGPEAAFARCVEHLRTSLEHLAAWLEEEKISRA